MKEGGPFSMRGINLRVVAIVDDAPTHTLLTRIVEATGELYVMQHEGMRGGGQVQVLGRFDSFAELHRLIAGWEDVCGEPGSIDWLTARLGRALAAA